MKNILKINKKILVGTSILFLLIVLIIILSLSMPKNLKLIREEVLLDGFITKETINITITKDEIKNIKLTKEIELSEYYDGYGTYYDSLEKILDSAYSYLNTNYNIKREENKMIINIDTKEKGIILNNLSIKYNGEDDTTLRYDAVTDLNDSSSIKIGDKISKGKLKSKLMKLGYKKLN